MALVTENESKLLTRLRVGERTALAEIFRVYSKELFEFARKSIEVKEDCEEIVQDVFVSLWERREVLEIDSLKAYLFTSVKYKVIRYIKHLAVKRKYEAHYRHFESNYIVPTDPEQEPSMIELHARLTESLQALPARCREAFQLRLEQNLSNTEIAQRLHISKRTVEDYMTIAFAHLRKYEKRILRTE